MENRILNLLNPKNPDTFPFVLIGNKCNKIYERKVEQKSIDQYCKSKLNMPYFETSAKDNINVEAAFEKAAELGLKRHLKYLKEDEDETFIPTRVELKPLMYKTKYQKKMKLPH